MSVPNDLQEHSICSMYRDGVSLHTLQVAFDRSADGIIEVLRRHGVVEPLRIGDDTLATWTAWLAALEVKR